MELLFYDIEVFKHDAFVVFKTADKELKGFFHNDFKGLGEFIKGKMLIGYNNYYYDDYILTLMIKERPVNEIKELNDRIINNQEHKKEVHQLINSIDCFQQIDVGMPGLKKIEGNMGKMILESDVSFDIDRELTDEELEESVEYCKYDVDTTIDVYNLRSNYFKTKDLLVERLADTKAKKWNTTTISANLLTSGTMQKWATIRIPEELLKYVDRDVLDMWYQLNVGNVIKKKTHTIKEFGNTIQFGLGGLHGAPDKLVRAEKVILLDVASMYPNIIININGLGNATAEYKKILDRRLEIKHKDKNESDALKLILNSVYGNMNNKYSKLNNPRAAYSVCVYGQIALYELSKRLSKHCNIININTDGVAFTTSGEDYKEIWKEWEKDFNLELEEDNFDLFIQKDVNNYIGVKNGKIKAKGGDVVKYNENQYFKNNNARIVDIAIVEYLVNGKNVLDTLKENINEPILYQYILQAGRTYKGTFDNQDKQYQKINRVFAVKEGVTLYKKRQDDGLVRFADTPDNMIVWNNDCSEIEDFKNVIDLNHYYQIIQKKLKAWE